MNEMNIKCDGIYSSNENHGLLLPKKGLIKFRKHSDNVYILKILIDINDFTYDFKKVLAKKPPDEISFMV